MYVNRLRDLSLAENHCSRSYLKAMQRIQRRKIRAERGRVHGSSSGSGSGSGENDEIMGSHSDADDNNDNDNNNNNAECDAETDDDRDEDNHQAELSIYLTLLGVMLSALPPGSSGVGTGTTSVIDSVKNNPNDNSYFDINDVLKLAEKYHDKIDPLSFLAILPKNIPLYKVEKYLRIALEFGKHKKRNLMVWEILFHFFTCVHFFIYPCLYSLFFTDRSVRKVVT
jgi:Vacuolar sorting protein 39 domain 2